jgi:hypothetical protein
MTQDYDIPADGPRSRSSGLASTAIFLAPILAIGIVGVALLLAADISKSGWGGFGQVIVFSILAQVVIYGGSITAAIAIVLGCVAQRQIRKQPDKFKGHRQARAAVVISGFSLLGVWGIIGLVGAVHSIRQTPHRAAEADILATFGAVVRYSRKSDTFPDTLEQVVSANTASNYLYFGKGLPSEYADYQTLGSQRIVVLYATQNIDGKFTAICANGMTHKWTKPILDKALRESDTLRNRLAEQDVAPDG